MSDEKKVVIEVRKLEKLEATGFVNVGPGEGTSPDGGGGRSPGCTGDGG